MVNSGNSRISQCFLGKDIRRKASGERKSVKSIIRVNVFHADEDDDEGQDEAARTSTSASSMTQSEATTKFTQKESTAISRTSSFVDETSKSDASKSEGDSTGKRSRKRLLLPNSLP